MRGVSGFGSATLALVGAFGIAAVGCTHPAPRSNIKGGSGGESGNGGESGGGSGTGGSSSGNGNGSGNGSSNPGAGGSETPGGGNPGAGGASNPGSTGTGGTTEVVLPPSSDAGGDAPPVEIPKMTCGDIKFGDKYSPGYVISADAANAAKTALASMTIADKAGQMRGTIPGGSIFNQPDNQGRGIKGFRFRDGPRGLCLDAEKVGNGYSTAFPVSIARGASFDLDLEYRIGAAIGDQTIASGHNMLLSPTVNILRHPFWGRAQETYGEDSYLLGRMGTAFTTGIQLYVPACAKHYAANNVENGRSDVNSAMDDQTLREVYANHFGMIVRDGGVACVMASYNPVQGVKATQNKKLLTDILRGEFGFKGFVLSDWWAMPGGANPGDTDTRKRYATEAVNAGMDMELPNTLNYSQLEAQVSAGALKQSQIDEMAGRILTEKFRFNVAKLTGTQGLKTPTTTYNNGSIANDAAHIALAQETAEKSMVLLKNDGALPIKRAAVKKIAVLGLTAPFTVLGAANQVNFATDVLTGDLGSSRVLHDPAKATSPFAGIRNVAGAGITVVSGNSAAQASDADFVVVVAGLTPQDEGEEYTGAGDRNTFSLNGKSGTKQNELIAAVAALKKPMVVVIEAGSVVDIQGFVGSVNAVVMAWYPGQQGGTALGRLLFGDVNFSGKLPITWDSNTANWPTFHNGGNVPMEYNLGYQFFDKAGKKPQFPFGHGLSYAKFEYGNIQVACGDKDGVDKKGVVNVYVEVQNTGTVKGDEVAFLFASYPGTKAPAPNGRHKKELKAFYRVSLNPGEKKGILIPVRLEDLRYWNNGWQVESGPVKVAVAGSSDDEALAKNTTTFTVK